jgi:hypothetical protein
VVTDQKVESEYDEEEEEEVENEFDRDDEEVKLE